MSPSFISLLIPAVLLASSTTTTIDAFSTHHCKSLPSINVHNQRSHDRPTTTTIRSTTPPCTTMRMMAKYGPDSDNADNNSNDDDDVENTVDIKQLKSDFTALLHKIIDDNNDSDNDNDDKNDDDGTSASAEYPSLFAQNIEMILEVISIDGLLEDVLQEDVKNYNEQLTKNGEDSISDSESDSRLDQLSEAVSLILSFVETFVEETKSTEDVYKQLLGKIFTSIAPSGSNTNNNDAVPSSSISSSAVDTEQQLDDLLSSSKEAFTPGFLRHVEGECERIGGLKTMSPESAKMLQILRVIQARVLEELGKGIGEGAVVLGQLLGYDDEAERLAVLDAGLAVRGVEFAQELALLTEEALEGFKNVPSGGVDPELVKGVEVIDERIRKFIGKSDFQ